MIFHMMGTLVELQGKHLSLIVIARYESHLSRSTRSDEVFAEDEVPVGRGGGAQAQLSAK